MTEHPEISHLAKEERIRAIAYTLWEEEGRPQGMANAHWQQAEELIEAEAKPLEENPMATNLEALDPDWLRREPSNSEPIPTQLEKTQTLDQLAKRIAGIKAA